MSIILNVALFLGYAYIFITFIYLWGKRDHKTEYFYLLCSWLIAALEINLSQSYNFPIQQLLDILIYYFLGTASIVPILRFLNESECVEDSKNYIRYQFTFQLITIIYLAVCFLAYFLYYNIPRFMFSEILLLTAIPILVYCTYILFLTFQILIHRKDFTIKSIFKSWSPYIFLLSLIEFINFLYPKFPKILTAIYILLIVIIFIITRFYNPKSLK